MIRAGAFLFALAAVALADTAVLVDGEVLPGVTFVRGDKATVVLRAADGKERTLPAAQLVSVAFDGAAEPLPDPYNLYLANGDRLRGRVAGAGEDVSWESEHGRLRFPLAAVRAVRFGRLLEGVKAKYVEAFRREMKRGRDVVIVQRDTRPFPVYASVLAAGEAALTVRLGDEKRELELRKIDGGFVARDAVVRLEFVGEHMRHLSSFEPIDVKGKALFGHPPRWRRDGMVLGGPLLLGGRTYARGIGVQAYSRVEFVLGGRWDAFFALCGIDDAAGREGEATFRVLGDGKVLAETTHRHGQPPRRVRVDVKGVDRLVLEARPGDSYVSDFCDWADARVFLAATVQDSPRDGE